MASYTTMPSATEPKPKAVKRFVACAAVASFVLGALAATAVSPKMETTTNLGQGGSCSPAPCYTASDLDEYQFPDNAEHQARAYFYDPNKKVKFNKELYHNGKYGNGVFEGGLYEGRDAFYWCSGDAPCEFYYYEQGTPDLPDKDGYKLWKASCDKAGCPGYYKVYAEDCKPSDYTGYDGKTKAKCTLNFYCMISNTDDMGMDC